MNYIPLILLKLKELRELSPDLTFGEMIYSILRPANLESAPEDVKIAWMMEIDDLDFFNSVSKLIVEEQEYKIERENAEKGT